jgi:hypothetical protein
MLRIYLTLRNFITVNGHKKENLGKKLSADGLHCHQDFLEL